MSFITRNWRGLALVVLGIGTVLAAHYFLNSCADAGKMMTTSMGSQVPMRCSWTERGIQGMGALVALMGLILMVWPESWRGISLSAAGAGLLMVITPLWLIPTCDNQMMTCNLSLKPGAVVLGAVIAIAGLLGSIRLRQYESGAGGVGRTA